MVIIETFEIVSVIPLQCSWGSKPNPPGTSSTPLPPPAAASYLEISATDLLSYDRQLALSKMNSNQAAPMQAQGQHALKQAAIGVGGGGSQAIYDGSFQNAAAAPLLLGTELYAAFRLFLVYFIMYFVMNICMVCGIVPLGVLVR